MFPVDVLFQSFVQVSNLFVVFKLLFSLLLNIIPYDLDL